MKISPSGISMLYPSFLLSAGLFPIY